MIENLKIDRNGLKVDVNLGGKPLKLPRVGFRDFAWKVGAKNAPKIL